MTVPAAVEGVDVDAVTSWFLDHTSARPPLRFELIAGGHSNLTYTVIDSEGSRWVLRRPPLGPVLPTAHDMGREHRVITALGGTDVPVPTTVGLCDDEAVSGAPFYVMEFVSGEVLRDPEAAAQIGGEAERRALGFAVAETLARIHDVNVDAVGLGDLGRREGYLERQLRRWHGQWERAKTRELPAVTEIHDDLASRLPAQQSVSLVHGDYRLDNCLVSGVDLAAILDWELCTLGDPLADLGLLMVYWTEPGDSFSAMLDAPTTVPGFPSRSEMLERYAIASGRDLASINFYVAFGYWKLACVLEGVYARYRQGAMGQEQSEYEHFAGQVLALVDAATVLGSRS